MNEQFWQERKKEDEEYEEKQVIIYKDLLSRHSDESRGAPVALQLMPSLKTAFRDEADPIASPKYRSRRNATLGPLFIPHHWLVGHSYYQSLGGRSRSLRLNPGLLILICLWSFVWYMAWDA